MSNGWSLSMSLISKHFGKLGDSLAEAIASFDPETATQVDRDRLAEQLRGFATKLAEARRKFDKEQKEADELRVLIANDEKAAEILIGKFEAGQIDEATLNMFADELESNKARLPQEEAEANDAKELVTALEDLFRTIEKQLADFDTNAKKAINDLNRAKAEKERQELRQQNQEQLRALKTGLSGSSTALGALAKKAEKERVAADAAKIVADSGQKDVDKSNAVEEARKIAAGTSTQTMSAVDRLRGLSK